MGGRQKKVVGQTPNVEIHLRDPPGFFDLPLMGGGMGPVSENGDLGLAAVGDVHSVDVPVVLDHRLGARLPENAVVPIGVQPEQPGVLELHEEARPLAEVSPNGVVDDFELGPALRLPDRPARVQLQYETVFVVYYFLPDADGVYEQARCGPRIQSLH